MHIHAMCMVQALTKDTWAFQAENKVWSIA